MTRCTQLTVLVPLIVGLSLRQPNSTNIPLLAGDAQNTLGDSLDAFLLGNVSAFFAPSIVFFCAYIVLVLQEPDLYTRHGQRPNLKNYTVQDYSKVNILR